MNSAEGAKCNSPAQRVGFRGPTATERWKREMWWSLGDTLQSVNAWATYMPRLQRSESICAPDPGRWPGLSHL